MSTVTTGGKSATLAPCIHTYMIELSHPLIPLNHRLVSMNKENHASRRLGSESYYKPGNEIMYPMPEKTVGNESSTYNSEEEDQRFLSRHSTLVGSIAAAYFATIIIYLLMSRMWNEDEIRLHLLSALTRIFQALARTFGLWALECENAYNEYVSILH